ncbi:MAG TPA: AsmA family protein [Thioalkalivibrio sp.]|nr:AsmA family protein [Thioalkalivibrio sp.]
MKIVWRLLGLLGILVTVALIVGVYLVLNFDPNAYKARIENAFEDATGRELTLEGPIELTLFPSLGLRLEAVRVGNAPGFEAVPFAELRVVEVAVTVLPLLRNELDVQRIAVDGGRLQLSRTEDGSNNWNDLVARLEAAQEETRDARAGSSTGALVVRDVRVLTASGDGGSARRELQDLRIAGLNLTDLSVAWDDRQRGARMTLAPLNLRLSDFRPGVESPLRLDARLDFQPDEGEPMLLELHGDALLNIDLSARRYALRRTGADLGLRLPGIEPMLEIRLETDLLLDMAASRLQAAPISARFSDLLLEGGIEITGLAMEYPQLRADFASNRFDPRAVLTALGLDAPTTTDPEALREMALKLSATGDARGVEIGTLEVGLDETSLAGTAAVVLSEARPRLEFDLAGDRMNLDRYLPAEVEEVRAVETAEPALAGEDAPTAGEAGTSGGQAQVEEGVPIRLPVGLMRAFDLDGRLVLEHLTLLGLVLEEIELVLRAHDGNWRVEPLTGNAYQGRLDSRAGVDVRPGAPRFDLTVALDGIALGPLLEDLREGAPRLVGNGSVNLALGASGATVGALTSSLNGQGTIGLVDGAVRGIHVERIIRHADARLRGEAPEDDGEPNQTDFEEFSGSFDIVDGVIRNDDLVARSSLLLIQGQGSADLKRETMDYRIDTTVVSSIQGQGGRTLDELEGLTLPIRIAGTFAEPSFRLNLEDVLRERLEDRVRREAGRLLERYGLGASSEPGPDADQDPGLAPADSRSLEQRLERLLERGLR